jgi:DNA-directed RNA polymerase specialized sigma24 family protein
MHRRLRHSDLGRVYEPCGIWDEIVVVFLRDLRRGLFRLRGPADMRHVLQRMALCRLVDRVRHDRWEMDGTDRSADSEQRMADMPADEDPAERVSQQELLDMIRNRLSPKQWQMVWSWAQGESWDNIAATVGGTAEDVRKQLSRTIHHLREELTV